MPGKLNSDAPGGSAGALESNDTLAEFERLVANLAQPQYVFRLYVSGSTPRSALAIANVRGICERYLPGRYDLEVVDVYQQPAATRSGQVVAVPTLIKELPLPTQRFVGDMSDTERIVIGLNLKE
jgi:circadian clock protein KaiB